MSHHRDTPEDAPVDPQTLSRMRTRTFTAIREREGYGATCDEVECITGMLHQTASARICELVAMGLLEVSELRRETRTMRTARVYVVKKE
jgi:hypothetical protein